MRKFLHKILVKKRKEFEKKNLLLRKLSYFKKYFLVKDDIQVF